MTTEQIERIFEVIIAHQRIPKFDGTHGQRCVGCGHCDGATDGPNSPRHARHVAAEIAPVVADLITDAVNQARGESWDECVDRICSPDESGTANNARFKRANPYRGEATT